MEEIEAEINLSEPEVIVPYQPPKCKSQNITVEKLKKFMPKGTASKVTEEIVAYINNIENDKEVIERLFDDCGLVQPGWYTAWIEKLTK